MSKPTNRTSWKSYKTRLGRLFPPPYETVDKGHGRIETRRIITAPATCIALEFPGAKQIFHIEREVFHTKTQKLTSELVLGITSLDGRSSPARLLKLNRGHWAVENKSHLIRDVTFDEDRCRARSGFGPMVLATFRNSAISVLKLVGINSVASGLRTCSRNPAFALRALGINPAS